MSKLRKDKDPNFNLPGWDYQNLNRGMGGRHLDRVSAEAREVKQLTKAINRYYRHGRRPPQSLLKKWERVVFHRPPIFRKPFPPGGESPRRELERPNGTVVPPGTTAGSGHSEQDGPPLDNQHRMSEAGSTIRLATATK